MKKQKRLLSILIVLAAIVFAIPLTCRADNDQPVKEQNVSCSSSTDVHLIVSLGPSDCVAMDKCSWRVEVYGIDDCNGTNATIASASYTYPDDIDFGTLTICGGCHIKVCVVLTSQCNYHYSIPPCYCDWPPTTGELKIPFDVCGN